jgi:hypothetical protein
MNLRPKDFAIIGVGIAVVIALAYTLGWNKLKQAGSAPTAASFKESFLNSCGRKAPDKLQYCECFYKGLESAQVTNESEAKIMEYIKSPDGMKIAGSCLKALVASNPALLQKTPPATPGKPVASGKKPASSK